MPHSWYNRVSKHRPLSFVYDCLVPIWYPYGGGVFPVMAIEKRSSADGTPSYRARIATTDPVSGRRKNVTVGTYRTKKEAEKAERDALTQQERGTLVDPSKLTVADLLKSWLANKAGTISANSQKDYEITIRLHIVPALGTVSVQKLNPAQLQAQFTVWRDAGLKPRTLTRCHSILNQALTQAMEWGFVYRNVCTVVKRPTLTKRAASVWSPDEARAFLDASLVRPVLTRAGDTGKTRPDDLTPLWHFLVLEGMRRGEALGLRWADVNWERGTVHISQTVVADKNNKGKAIIQPRAKTTAGARSVKLAAETLSVLKEHRDRQRFVRQSAGDTWQDHNLIVCSGIGTPVNPNNVTRSYTRLVMLSGVPEIRVHDMRHTAATMMLRAGVPAKIVSERLGHANIGITLDTYSHVLPDMQDIAVEAMNRLMAPKSDEKAGTA